MEQGPKVLGAGVASDGAGGFRGGVGQIGSLELGIWVLTWPLVGQGASTGSVGYYRVRRRGRAAGVSQGMFWGMVGGP